MQCTLTHHGKQSWGVCALEASSYATHASCESQVYLPCLRRCAILPSSISLADMLANVAMTGGAREGKRVWGERGPKLKMTPHVQRLVGKKGPDWAAGLGGAPAVNYRTLRRRVKLGGGKP